MDANPTPEVNRVDNVQSAETLLAWSREGGLMAVPIPQASGCGNVMVAKPDLGPWLYVR